MEKFHKKSFPDNYRALFLGAILLIVGFFAKGQATYNPTAGTVSNKPYSPAQAVPTDSRSYKYDSINFLWRPYNGTSEVLTYLNLLKYRTGQFVVLVNVGGSLQSNGTFIGGTINPYWFLRGQADSQLVFMNTNAAGGGPFFAVANNLSEGTAGTMRTNLGLGTMATQSTTASSTDVSGTWPGGLIVNSVQGANLANLRNYLNLKNTPAIPPQINITDAGLFTHSGTYPNLTFSSATPTFQQTLTAGNALSGTGSINTGVFDFRLSGTSDFGIPVGTTAQRSSSPSAGDERYNLDSAGIEFYNGSAWRLLGTGSGGGGGGITALTGDGTASGTGSVPFTLATVNSNVFGSNTFLKFGVNGKGLTTSATAVLGSDITGALGFTPYNVTNPAGYIPLTALSALPPLLYNNTTGVLSADTSTGLTKLATQAFVNNQGFIKVDSALIPQSYLSQTLVGSAKFWRVDTSSSTGLSSYYLRIKDSLIKYVTPSQLAASAGLQSLFIGPVAPPGYTNLTYLLNDSTLNNRPVKLLAPLFLTSKTDSTVDIGADTATAITGLATKYQVGLKQDKLTGPGYLKMVAGSPTYITAIPHADIAATAVTPGSYTNGNFTVGADGSLTAASNGSGGGTAANPTGTVGLSAVNGSLTTYMRSDAAPPLSQTITPTMTGLWSFTTPPSLKNLLLGITGSKILMKSGASDSAVQEIAIGSGLSISGGALIATAGGTGTPGGADSSIQTKGGANFIGPSYASLNNGLNLAVKPSTSGGGVDFNGLIFKPVANAGTADFSEIILPAVDSSRGNFYQGSVNNTGVNFGLLKYDNDVVTTMGWNYNYSATGGRVNPNLPSWGWRGEDNFPTGNDSVSYSELHFSMWPSTQYKAFTERRLLSFPCSNGTGAKRAGSFWDTANEARMEAQVRQIKAQWNTLGTGTPIEYFHTDGQGLSQVKNIDVHNIDPANNIGYTMEGNAVLGTDNTAGTTGNTFVGGSGKHVSIWDSLIVKTSSGSGPLFIGSTTNPIGLRSATLFVTEPGSTLPAGADPLAILSLNGNNSLNAKGFKTSRMNFTIFSSMVPTTADNALNVYDTTRNTNYIWNNHQWVPSYSGYSYFTPTTGSTITLVQNQQNVINPTAPIASLTLAYPFGAFTDGDIIDILFLKPVADVTMPSPLAHLKNANGHVRITLINGSTLFASEGGGNYTGKQQYYTHPTFTAASGIDSLTLPDIKQVDAMITASGGGLSGTGYAKFSGSTPSYLTPTQVTADLNLFTTSLQGLAPASGGGTTNFLRADGTWAAPPGGGGGTGIPGGNTYDVQFKNANGGFSTLPSSLFHVDSSAVPKLGFGTATPSTLAYFKGSDPTTTAISVENTSAAANAQATINISNNAGHTFYLGLLGSNFSTSGSFRANGAFLYHSNGPIDFITSTQGISFSTNNGGTNDFSVDAAANTVIGNGAGDLAKLNLYGGIYILKDSIKKNIAASTNMVVYDTLTGIISRAPIPSGGGTFANPSATIGLTAVNGSATTAMRSDAAPPLSQSITPTMTGQWIFNGGVKLNGTLAGSGTPNILVIGADSLIRQLPYPSGGTDSAMWKNNATLTGNRTFDGSSSNFSLNFGNGLGNYLTQASFFTLNAVNLVAATGSINLSGNLKYQFVLASDANLDLTTVYGIGIRLPVITANRQVTLPLASAVNIGVYEFININTAAFSWTFASTVKDLDGNTITAIPNGANIKLLSDGTTWYAVSRLVSSGNQIKYQHTIFTPTTGGTVALVNNQYNIINPAGALVALTVNLPSSPLNNDVVYIKFTQTVSTVTYGNGTVVDGITAPTAGGVTILTYDAATTSWY